ncbi:MAG TPA: hypothetical protein VGC99_26900 [Candidatus Tectomicrobia bacterium]
MKPSRFFSVQGKDERYEDLCVKPNCQEIHDFIEEMWKEYWPYADSDFLPKARNRDFQACYWEMYLGCSLLRQNMQIEPRAERKRLWGSSDKGPDFKIVAPYTLWLEAITPGAGTTEDAVPEAELGVARQVPDDEVKLRLLHAIRDKAKQRLRFIQEGWIDPTGCYVVAVNTGKLPHVPDLDPPRIVRAVLGLGFPQVSMDVNSGDVNSSALSNWRYQPQDRIFKRSSASSVSTRIFLDREQPDDPDHTGYEGLSAVLSSGMTPFNSCEPWFDHNKFVIGDDYCIMHNPLANEQNQLPHGFLKCGREYWLNNAGVLDSNIWFKDREQ